jgi:hypothetical protein
VEGWSTQNITTPTISGANGLAGKGTPYKAFSLDLSEGLVWNGFPTAGEAPIENPPMVLGAPAGYQNFYLRSNTNDSLRALLTFSPNRPAQGFFMEFEGASPDLRHVVVSTDSALTAGGVVESFHPNLYEWTGGVWRAINVLPEAGEGETKPDATLGSGEGESRTVSDDGSRVFWNDAILGGRLFVRENGSKTVQLDASKGGAVLPGERHETDFQTASSDGSVAFFTSHSPLTTDAKTGPLSCPTCTRPGSDLYGFDVNSSTLRDLSVDPSPADPNGAEVHGVLGASEDGSYVYFVAASVLLAGPNAEGQSPSSGANLYLWHEAPGKPSISFVASLADGDRYDWTPQIRLHTARITPSGGAVAFMSSAHLTNYDNRDAVTGSPDEELYLYNATSARLTCVSCNPNGARPVGASNIPAGAPFELRLGGAMYQPRALSNDGSRVFFNSSNALVSQDTNGTQDVYAYENGHVSLLSGGTDPEGAEFVDASSSGNDVFFLTRQELVRGDTDQLVDLYDARVGGGIEEPLSPSPCEGESCKPEASTQPTFAPRGSAVFKGAGNLAPPAPAPAKKVKAKKKTKKPKHKAKRRAKRSRAARRRA